MAAALPFDPQMLRTPPTAVFKHDRRSRVWRIPAAATFGAGDGGTSGRTWGGFVVKRFGHAIWKQRLAALLGLHPAQREYRANRRLIAAGIPVAPILWRGWHHDDAGAGMCLVTPYGGESLEFILTRRRADTARLAQIRRALATLAADLLGRRVFFKDLKTSNLLVAEDGTLCLIDVGSARRLRGKTHVLRMLAMLDRTAARDGASRTDRLRTLGLVCRQAPALGDVKSLAHAIAAVRLK